MNHFTNRQVVVLCVLSVGFGALFSPPMRSVAQPPENSGGSENQPLETPTASTSDRTTRAVGTITGEGRAGYISKFTGANAIGDSVLFESSGKVGLGTTTPSGMFTANSSTNNVAAITGAHSNLGIGVFGQSANSDGMLGHSNSGAGVRGRHILGSGTAPGVSGETNSTSSNATGVQGIVNSTSPGGFSAGVRGINNGTSGLGVGVYGTQAGSGYGIYGYAPSGIGIVGSSSSGIAVYGNSSTNYGVEGISNGSTGVYGVSTNGIGVSGTSSNSVGIKGNSTGGFGVEGTSSTTSGVKGTSTASTGAGVNGSGYIGVQGMTTGTGAGSQGVRGDNGGSNTVGYAGYFNGRVTVNGNLNVLGTLSKNAGSFRIDHPQHPATEYLSHSFVESPDMMNVYNGNVTTDAKGQAWVQLPSYFQSLNRDFRYQLTPIGQFAQVIVGQEIKGTRFQIKTDKPNVKVSWMVTGIRNDAYARQHRIRVEEVKTGADRGKYLYPAGFGAGPDKQIDQTSPRIAKR